MEDTECVNDEKKTQKSKVEGETASVSGIE